MAQATGEDRGDPLKPWNTPRSNGSTGSTTDDCSRQSTTSRLPKTLACIGAVVFVALAITATAIEVNRPADRQDDSAAPARPVAERDPLRAELARCSQLGEAGEPASANILQAGAVIAAALITGIRSDLPGQITAQVTENIYGSPTGTRATLYLRVSTTRQAEHDVSIPDQKRQGETFCAARG